jgi:predicted kinase
LTQIRKPHCYFLVGLPGSGKSTWAEQRFLMPIVGTDRWIDKFAQELGNTYNDVFDSHIKEATRLFDLQVNDIVYQSRDFVWDQTNLTVKSRRAKLARLTGYSVSAVVFEIDPDELARRQANRPGKTIPDHILRSMTESYQRPTLEEGFSRINIVKE